MSRYEEMFARLARRREGAFGGFIMLGDPTPSASARLLDALVEGGADMIEVGIPFSDPIADGPVIQAAAARALAAGTSVKQCFALLAEFRARHPAIPVGILTYANLVVSRGAGAFYEAAAEAGVDSVLVADVPALEAGPFAEAAGAAGIDHVMIAAANSGAGALERIARLGRGYTYCVSRAGVTGAGSELRLDHRALLDRLAALGAPPPVLGFGISRRDHVRLALEEGAAGVICGSAIVRLAESTAGNPAIAVRSFVESMKLATKLENRPRCAAKLEMENGDVRR